MHGYVLLPFLAAVFLAEVFAFDVADFFAAPLLDPGICDTDFIWM
jgi:hypothetical protein